MKTMTLVLFLVLSAMAALTKEETLSQDKRGSGDDILSNFSCRYLKIKGYLKSNAKLKNLCLKTYHCNDVLSKQSCIVLKARKECTKYTKLSQTYCPFTCNKCGAPLCKKSVPLGMQSKGIPDSQITASSSHNKHYLPSKARLHMHSYGWTPLKNRPGEWLQVDLGSKGLVTGIATQGSKLSSGEWTKSYSLQYSLDGKVFHKYKAGKVFQANVDKNSVVKHNLSPPIQGRYVRFYPKTWHSWPSTRLELYGCR